MFERKLKALGYLEWDKVNGNDTEHFRKVIMWLEDQKIRHYTIEDRKDLRNITSPEWPKTFQKYCNDVNCPVTENEADQLEWFIGHAVWLEFADDREKYQQVKGSKAKSKEEVNIPSVKSANPLDNLDFRSNDFRTGVSMLAKSLKIAEFKRDGSAYEESDHLVRLQACSKLVCNRLNADAIKQPIKVPSKKEKEMASMALGSDFITYVDTVDTVARCLRLLYIQDLRNLQTKINETIVSVQNITANPKTDTKLGKVGK